MQIDKAPKGVQPPAFTSQEHASPPSAEPVIALDDDTPPVLSLETELTEKTVDSACGTQFVETPPAAASSSSANAPLQQQRP